MFYDNVQRTPAWHSDGLRWIAGLLVAAADALERSQAAHALEAPPHPEYKPVDEFLYDVRFRVQHEIFLR